jgi:CheY-like chemotaxis protein
MMRPFAAEAGVQICDAVTLNSDQYVNADRRRLEQVLLNLLSNAIKYNHEAGRVEVSSENAAPGRVRVNITDTGTGIPAEYQQRMFAPFERLDSDERNVQGTGLGLALSRKLIELMGGGIGVESCPGSGSTFWIDLPSTEEPSKRIEPRGSLPSAIPQSFSVAVILCVDDNTANLRLMEYLLVDRPQTHLLFAMQGRLALELAMKHTPDLIFLDLHLPDLSGEIVLRQLRAHPSTQSIPIVMVSADVTPGQIQNLINAGATEYVTKPYELDTLLRIVDEHLKGGRHRPG